MKIKITYIILIGFLAISIVFFVFTQKGPGQYDEFAHCLTEKGAVFYGSFQCPHCNTQKNLFGKSIKYVNYVECGPLSGPLDKKCIEAGVKAFPTWVINNVMYTEVQDLNTLSKLTGCPLS